MITSKSEDRDFAKYLNLRLEFLTTCNNDFENKLRKDKMALCREVDNGGYQKNDPHIFTMHKHFEYVLGNTFRYTMLIAVCSFLEEAMKEITTRLVPDYDERIKTAKRANWLRIHIRLLPDSVGLDTTSFQADVTKFYDFITLRNCIVHVWGKLVGVRNPEAVQSAIKRIKDAEVTKDGFLVLGDSVIPEAIITAEAIADHILKEKKQVSII